MQTCISEIILSFFSLNLLCVSGSSRKSILVPTRITGVFGQWCFTSGNHLPRTFSCDAGDTTITEIRLVSTIISSLKCALTREANKENIGLWIAKRSEAVVIFLSGGIPKAWKKNKCLDEGSLNSALKLT